MRQIEEFIDQVEKAIAGQLDDSQELELKTSIYRTYAYNNDTGFIARAANNDGWRQVLATLRDYRDRLDHELAVAQASSGNVSVNSVNDNRAIASSEASAVSLSVASYAKACNAVESLENIDDVEKEELLDLLHEVRKSKGDESLAKTAIKSLIDHAIEYGLDALKAVLPYVWAILLSLGGAA